jgi:hypothetical protein
VGCLMLYSAIFLVYACKMFLIPFVTYFLDLCFFLPDLIGEFAAHILQRMYKNVSNFVVTS